MNRLLARMLFAPAVTTLFPWMTDAGRAAGANVQDLTNVGVNR